MTRRRKKSQDHETPKPSEAPDVVKRLYWLLDPGNWRAHWKVILLGLAVVGTPFALSRFFEEDSKDRARFDVTNAEISFSSRDFPETYEAGEVLLSHYTLKFRVRNIGLSAALEIRYRATCAWKRAFEEEVPYLEDSDSVHTAMDLAAGDHGILLAHSDTVSDTDRYPICILSIDYRDSAGKPHLKETCWTTTLNVQQFGPQLELEPCSRQIRSWDRLEDR